MIVTNANDRPDNITLVKYFNSLTSFNLYNNIPTRGDYPKLLKFQLPNSLDFSQLIKDTQEALQIYGEWNYRLPDDSFKRKDASYGGLGLTYNPNYIDRSGNTDIHEQVQGTHTPDVKKQSAYVKGQLNPFSAFYNDINPQIIKNTHYDTYGFSHRTPASKHKSLGTFLDTFKRPMVRTALRIIYAENEGPVGDDKYAGIMWHQDEPMPVNLRVNIPLVTHPDYVLEQEGFDPVHLEPGYAYSWDTRTMHRAYAKTRTAPPRIHLMLGFSCWWDYDETTNTWSTNKFAGKKHPMDMLVDGDVIPGLKLLS
jgi:hypothetical protein